MSYYTYKTVRNTLRMQIKFAPLIIKVSYIEDSADIF